MPAYPDSEDSVNGWSAQATVFASLAQVRPGFRHPTSTSTECVVVVLLLSTLLRSRLTLLSQERESGRCCESWDQARNTPHGNPGLRRGCSGAVSARSEPRPQASGRGVRSGQGTRTWSVSLRYWMDRCRRAARGNHCFMRACGCPEFPFSTWKRQLPLLKLEQVSPARTRSGHSGTGLSTVHWR